MKIHGLRSTDQDICMLSSRDAPELAPAPAPVPRVPAPAPEPGVAGAGAKEGLGILG